MANTATCSSCVVRFMIVLNTRYTSANEPSTRVVAMSPMVTAMPSAPGLARSWSTIGGDSSMPVTGTPRACNGTATRPVPIASSSAAPPAASSASRSTIGSRTAGSNIGADVRS